MQVNHILRLLQCGKNALASTTLRQGSSCMYIALKIRLVYTFLLRSPILSGLGQGRWIVHISIQSPRNCLANDAVLSSTPDRELVLNTTLVQCFSPLVDSFQGKALFFNLIPFNWLHLNFARHWPFCSWHTSPFASEDLIKRLRSNR